MKNLHIFLLFLHISSYFHICLRTFHIFLHVFRIFFHIFTIFLHIFLISLHWVPSTEGRGVYSRISDSDPGFEKKKGELRKDMKRFNMCWRYEYNTLFHDIEIIVPPTDNTEEREIPFSAKKIGWKILKKSNQILLQRLHRFCMFHENRLKRMRCRIVDRKTHFWSFFITGEGGRV